MSLFQNVLADLQKKIFKESTSKDTIVNILEETLKVKLSPDQIKVKEGILIITAMPTVKMALKLKEGVVIEALKSRGVSIRAIR